MIAQYSSRGRSERYVGLFRPSGLRYTRTNFHARLHVHNHHLALSWRWPWRCRGQGQSMGVLTVFHALSQEAIDHAGARGVRVGVGSIVFIGAPARSVLFCRTCDSRSFSRYQSTTTTTVYPTVRSKSTAPLAGSGLLPLLLLLRTREGD